MPLQNEEKVFQGVSISEGLAWGLAFFLPEKKTVCKEVALETKDLEGEIERYRQALKKSSHDVQCLKNSFQQDGCSVILEIFDTHLEILRDPVLTVMMEEKIRDLKKNSESVFRQTIEDYINRFKKVSDPFFRERLKDITDVSHRVINHLLHSETQENVSIPEQSIVFAREIVPSDIADVRGSFVESFVTEVGGFTSHAAIIARARGIPYISDIPVSQLRELGSGFFVIVDGTKGQVIVNPSEETKRLYQNKKESVNREHNHRLEQLYTKDQTAISLYGNMESMSDVDLLKKYQASGVGLFRSEVFFASDKIFPTEARQVSVYREIAAKMSPHPVVIRLFDVRGEKNFWKDQKKEDVHEMNPALGCRGVRFLLQNTTILDEQLRAIVQASLSGSIKLLIPLVSDKSEIIFVKSRLAMIQKELNIHKNISVGCMIEVPSAAIMSDEIAKYVDFLSIGTNDLTQYVLAADRSNSHMNYFYEGLHPSVFRLLKLIVDNVKNAKPIQICGEIGSNPVFTEILLALGIREFSVTSRQIPLLQERIQKIDLTHAESLLKEALSMTSVEDFHKLMIDSYMGKGKELVSCS